MDESTIGNLNNYLTQPRFGVAGFPPNFFESEFGKKRENIFTWLKKQNLDWIELQCTRGVKMRPEQAQLYRTLANENNIGISIHGPYFISLASSDAGVVLRSRERILQCFELADLLGAHRIVFHPGCYPGKTPNARKGAVKQIINELNELKNDIPSGVYIYPETAGKNYQIGTVDEVLDICEQVDFARPCIDFAHVHAFEHGILTTVQSIVDILNLVDKRLGKENLNNLHIHMYPIDFDSHGEKKHKAFSDVIESPTQLSIFEGPKIADCFFPRAEHFVMAIKEMNIYPVVICEAYNTQDIGSVLMKTLFYSSNSQV